MEAKNKKIKRIDKVKQVNLRNYLIRFAQFLLCFIVAFIFWFLHHLEKVDSFKLFIPVEYKNIPTNLKLRNELPNKWQINIKGKGSDCFWTQQKLKKQVLEVDLSKYKNDNYLKTNNLREELHLKQLINQDYVASDITQGKVLLDWTIAESKKIPVRSNINPIIPTGFYHMDEVKFVPDSIILKGPKEELDNFEGWYTSRYTPRLTGNYETLAVDLLPGYNIEIEPQKVNAIFHTLKFTEVRMERHVELALNQGFYNKSVEFFPNKVKLIFLAPSRSYDIINDYKHIRIFANPPENSDNTEWLDLKVTGLPTFAKGVRCDPPYIRYVISNKL